MFIILWDKYIYIYIGEEIKIEENKELKNKVRKQRNTENTYTKTYQCFSNFF